MSMLTSTSMSVSTIRPRLRTTGIPPESSEEEEREARKSQEEPIKIIEFCHPGYNYPDNILFRLPALDLDVDIARHGSDGDGDGDGGTPGRNAGVHHETARLACCILAGNVWDGWFTINEPDGPRVDADISHMHHVNTKTEAILTASRYYFHIDHHSTRSAGGTGTVTGTGTGTGGPGDKPYPIVRNFASWHFPRGDLPAYWQDLVVPPVSASSAQDARRCTVSGRLTPLEDAHIIPLYQSTWFDRNHMGTLQPTTSSAYTRWINQPPNILPLTKDIHHLLDKTEHFAFAPRRLPQTLYASGPTAGIETYTADKRYASRSLPSKSPSTSTSKSVAMAMAMVCHVLRPGPANEVSRIYHSRSLEPLRGILPEYLFASFALKICNLCSFFQDDGVRRYCIELQVDDTDGTISYAVRVAAFDYQKPSRSPTMRRDSSQASSSKRARSSGQDGRDEGEVEVEAIRGHAEGLFASFRSDGTTDNARIKEAESPEPRGRTLKRSLPRMTWSPGSPDTDPLDGAHGNWLLTDEPFPLVVDYGDGDGDGDGDGHGLNMSYTPSHPRKRRRREISSTLQEESAHSQRR